MPSARGIRSIPRWPACARREAVARKFQLENGLACTWQDTIVRSGGKQVIYNAPAATLNVGNEVIVPAPYWVSYPELVQLCGGWAVITTCDNTSGFKLTGEKLSQAISARTRCALADVLFEASACPGAFRRHL